MTGVQMPTQARATVSLRSEPGACSIHVPLRSEPENQLGPPTGLHSNPDRGPAHVRACT